MGNLLKPYTIIPAELYVKRDADRQLQNILDDMGRPGYVLVSRQMGKTNLLLNAKREAETPDDIFVYIDLSNPFATAKDCFENIIDTILEIHDETLNEVSEDILISREKSENVPPHKAHTSELRKIIRAIKGKLVIILDEIDALTKTNYSDRIFSQIRSVYFTRVNFIELERLTYVLSGVVEPSEIIKDSKISPFNIGQKIFLNDFKIEEFIDFTSKAKLSLTEDILNHIYNWTNGNPRITWDVCSELEQLANEKEITSEVVDDIIKDIYLTSYDKPPVDNIRELIKADAELRNAIIEIEYKKGEKVSDRIKSKLYLAGIINYTNGDIRIKNEVIKRAINLDWINSINEEEKGLTKIALEHFDKGEFAQCLSSFKKYLQNNSFSKSEKSIYYYYMGYSAYRTSNNKEGIQYLNKTDFDIEDETKFFYMTHNLKGLLYYYTDNIDLSLEHFKSVLSRGKKDEIFARALVNFGSISLASDNSIHIDEAKELFNEVIDESNIDGSQIEASLLDELKAISYYNLAQIELENKRIDDSIDLYKKAVNIAPTKVKPKIMLSYLSVIKDESSKIEMLENLTELIETSSLKPSDFDPDKPMNFDFEQFMEYIIQLNSIADKSLYNKAKSDIGLLDSKSLGDNLYDIALHCINKNLGLDVATNLLNEIYDNKHSKEYSVSKDIAYKTIKVISYFTNPKDGFAKLQDYISQFQAERLDNIDFVDIENFANYIYQLIEKKKFKEALSYIEIIKAQKKNVSEQFLINYLVIHNLELNIHISLANEVKSRETAENILVMANDDKISKQKSNLLGKDGLAIIKTNAESILKPKAQNIQPIRREQKIGRNDIVKVKYKDGSIKECKYKKVENDINSDKCILL